MDPSKTSAAYDIMAPRWTKIRRLLAGTEAMREEGETFLPKMSGEAQENYEARKASTFLYPAFREAVNTTLAKPLSKPITLDEKAPQEIVAWANNVDLKGSTLDGFARRFMFEAASVGMAHILVSYPAEGQRQVTAAGNTAADQMARRPHFELVTAENLLAAYVELIDGVPTLSHIRVREQTQTIDRTDFTETTVERVRVYERDSWQLWEKGTSGWSVVDQGVLDPIGIPLVTLMWGDPEGDYQVRPYFLDLADKNIEHWQTTSHEVNAGIQSCFAMLVCTGAGLDQVGDVVIGPKQLVAIPGEGVDLKYVEPSGTGIQWAVDKLKTIEEQMHRIGLRPLMAGSSPGNITATARTIDETQANSEVQAFAIATRDALARAFQIAMGFSRKGSENQPVGVRVNTDFLPLTMNEGGDLLLKARATGDLSRQTFWEELRRRSTLSESFNADEEKARLAQERIETDDETDDDPADDMAA